MSYRIHQIRLIPHIVNNYAITAFANSVKAIFGRKRSREENREFQVLTACLKVVASNHISEATQSSRECCGGQGLLARNLISPIRNDSDMFKTLEADNVVHTQDIAGYVISKFADTYGNGMGQVYYAGRWLKSFFVENPITLRICDHEYLLRSSFHEKTFLYREFHLVRSLASRVRSRVEKGIPMFEVWNELGDHVAELGEAHIERCVYDSFIQSINDLPSESNIRPVLTDLCSFYALWHFMKHKAWFLERGYFNSSRSKAIRTLVNHLCQKIASSALPLINSWAIPDSFFEDTIASPDFPLNHSREATPWL